MLLFAMVAAVATVGCGKVEAPAECTTEAQCTDSARPVCAADGVCVGCEESAQCAAAAPICDPEARACRGCSQDAECGGGVCLEAAGSCASDDEVAFVTMMGNDTGTCSRQAPCATLAFALAQAGARKIIHVLGNSLSTPGITLTSEMTLDGEDTALSTGSPTMFTIQGAKVTIEGFDFSVPTGAGMPMPAVVVSGAAQVKLHDVAITGPTAISATGGEVELTDSHIGTLSGGSQMTSSVICNNAKLRVEGCVFELSEINDGGGACELTVARNRFDSSRDGSVRMTSGQLIMENNLIVHRDGFNDSILAVGLRAGSTIRYNTIANTTALPSDGAAISCDASVAVTSNIIAYNSGHPITGTGCEPRYTIFDEESLTSAGTGNQVTGIDAIFVNRAAGDYHLAATSLARGAAEPGLIMVKTDLDGNARPNPEGTAADAGAFEAP